MKKEIADDNKGLLDLIKSYLPKGKEEHFKIEFVKGYDRSNNRIILVNSTCPGDFDYMPGCVLVYLNGHLLLSADDPVTDSVYDRDAIHSYFCGPELKNCLPTVSISCLARLILGISSNKDISLKNKQEQFTIQILHS